MSTRRASGVARRAPTILEPMSKTTGIAKWVLTPYASRKLEYRAIGLDIVRRVVEARGHQEGAGRGRARVQRKAFRSNAAQEYLVRVFVDVDRQTAEVVTVYRTSR